MRIQMVVFSALAINVWNIPCTFRQLPAEQFCSEGTVCLGGDQAAGGEVTRWGLGLKEVCDGESQRPVRDGNLTKTRILLMNGHSRDNVGWVCK
jgi:hypothetical protein